MIAPQVIKDVVNTARTASDGKVFLLCRLDLAVDVTVLCWIACHSLPWSLEEPNDDIIVAEKKKTLMAEYNGQKKIVLVIENLTILRASKIKAIIFMERKGCENVTGCWDAYKHLKLNCF